MSNTIKIKRGSGAPTSLNYGELGYDTTNGYLYIGNSNNATTGLKVNYASSAGSATTATTCTGNAATATKLAYERTFMVNLGVDDVCLFDGSSSATLGVTGILPAHCGGTGESSISTFVLNNIYPIGSIYMSVNSTSPASLFGGTWERIKDVFLLAAGDTYTAGETGGEAEHTLVEEELPKISGSVNIRAMAWSNNGYSHGVGAIYGKFSKEDHGETLDSLTRYGNCPGIRLTYAFGGDQAHNNMPPYLAVYMWKRVEDETE